MANSVENFKKGDFIKDKMVKKNKRQQDLADRLLIAGPLEEE